MLALNLAERITERFRNFSLAVTIVPSRLNSITACDLLIASTCANAACATELLRENISNFLFVGEKNDELRRHCRFDSNPLVSP